MNIYTGLLFQHGYIQNPELAVSLAQDSGDLPAPTDAPVAKREDSRQGRDRGAFRLGALAVLLNDLMSPPR
ncbi:MAG TPA: hypothetical protein VIT90_08915 [Lysobacter sp.]